MTATAPNRHDPDRVPGGSSSGAAASVAFGLAPAAIGSDTGGSIRAPAAWADLVGVKPTHGALPMEGAVALCRSLDTAGPLCRSVEDGALILALLGMPQVDLRGASLAGCRLAIPEGLVMDDLDGAPAEAFDAAVRRLRDAGARIVRIDVRDLLERAFALIGPVYAGEAWAEWKPLVEAKGEAMFAEVRERVSSGAAVGAVDFIAAWARLRLIRAEWTALTAGIDAVICPTVPIDPPKVADIAGGGDAYRSANLKALRNTRMANFLGLPSISLPTGRPGSGLLLSGHAGQDARLLRLAAAAERALA